MSQKALPSNVLGVKKGSLRITRLPYWALAKFGFVLGGLGCLVPALLISATGFAIVHLLRNWLEGMQKINIQLLGRDITTIDLIAALRVQGLLATLQAVDNAGAFTAFGITILLALVGAVTIALLCLVIAVGYNILAWLSGGVAVEVEGSLPVSSWPQAAPWVQQTPAPAPDVPALAAGASVESLASPAAAEVTPPALAPGESSPALDSPVAPPSTLQSDPPQ
ncbi:MAG: DUF3566 domain-containing protein [Anaerolineae bacterium]